MENSDSNLSQTQALQRQATKILPSLTAHFSQLGYKEFLHQRISQQKRIENDQSSTMRYQIGMYQKAVYKGLTRARHDQYGNVMIKWQLSDDNNHQEAHGLSHEISVLQALNQTYDSQKDIFFVPQILTYQTVDLQVLKQVYQLTILVMPYYAQGSLANQLSDKNPQPLTTKQKHQIIIQAAQLIANLHKQDWLHNDIKPSNILLEVFLSSNADSKTEVSNLLLTDFALAEKVDSTIGRKVREQAAGTPAYLAPERWQGHSITQQSDIYAFGVMIYEIVVGKRPFTISKYSSDPMRDWAIQHCQRSALKLSKEHQHYQRIINKALAKRVENRYQSMEEVLMDLECESSTLLI